MCITFNLLYQINTSSYFIYSYFLSSLSYLNSKSSLNFFIQLLFNHILTCLYIDYLIRLVTSNFNTGSSPLFSAPPCASPVTLQVSLPSLFSASSASYYTVCWLKCNLDIVINIVISNVYFYSKSVFYFLRGDIVTILPLGNLLLEKSMGQSHPVEFLFTPYSFLDPLSFLHHEYHFKIILKGILSSMIAAFTTHYSLKVCFIDYLVMILFMMFSFIHFPNHIFCSLYLVYLIFLKYKQNHYWFSHSFLAELFQKGTPNHLLLPGDNDSSNTSQLYQKKNGMPQVGLEPKTWMYHFFHCAHLSEVSAQGEGCPININFPHTMTWMNFVPSIDSLKPQKIERRL
ncbi:hypothetical protein VP01_114g1 [Puccinia sorghi]|uniref:Uncharacterized protein n=1 Tax=Puccinia sorghi TaxID=27349 RepID=A0A0L6VRS6_9BASI|nr:hypothetical protein VP01_114g1 [Puccinia sorghi]